MNAFTENLKSEYFDLFVEFIEQCAVYYVDLANRTVFSRILLKLFEIMDTTKVNFKNDLTTSSLCNFQFKFFQKTGFLIRRRLIPIFDAFEKNGLTSSKSNELRSPTDWPLLDPFIKFENKLEETRPGSDFSTKEVKLINCVL